MTCLCLFMLYVYDVVNLSMLYVYDIVNLSMLYVYDVVNLWCTCIYSLTTGLSPQSLCVLTTVGNYCLASATTAQLGELSTSLGCNSSRALAHHIDHTVKDDVETRWPLWYGQDGGWDMPGCRVSRCRQVSLESRGKAVQTVTFDLRNLITGERICRVSETSTVVYRRQFLPLINSCLP